ncbi:hypothetical protein H2199_004976 [Coniosporium tulheliwenetii]|uniref:Uncharacterized protein n=1 Tax=Coniosporium tulheliwenetii TaxID=3383036 RepID=A0ACC2Z388_9PEZI|nr:hypothetical protein H2199_004976 [Cladosporium sp. JES 115]
MNLTSHQAGHKENETHVSADPDASIRKVRTPTADENEIEKCDDIVERLHADSSPLTQSATNPLRDSHRMVHSENSLYKNRQLDDTQFRSTFRTPASREMSASIEDPDTDSSDGGVALQQSDAEASLLICARDDAKEETAFLRLITVTGDITPIPPESESELQSLETHGL